MMRRCWLLFAFLFCINQLAWLNAVSVQNWSSIFKDKPSKNWVILVAGTNACENYRHQADVFHAYQIVRKNNVPAENIITFAYDDIANNPRNPFKGKVFHDYLYEDIYQGVEIDYRGKVCASTGANDFLHQVTVEHKEQVKRHCVSKQNTDRRTD
ncbi:hypothetical protein T265_10941 [Opisthorchis viverrini]|uniref:Peptidase C13 family protein n=1 Tax=Opisthorchis viverrini TaxID=6198 RepID=A0A074Z0P2_OPIVI|nr:hypothetical protein T265_10941 [Opisthorchis viverrini]KER20528.1 hypothetical protein T265_10941 [Opisthorchis viverrini]